MENLTGYWDAVQSTVCTHCIDSDGNGNCRVDAEEGCALMVHFPAVVEAILSTESDSLGPYMKALRERVCTICEGQGSDGVCRNRNAIACGLDRHVPMVVDAIESVTPFLSGTENLSPDAA